MSNKAVKGLLIALLLPLIGYFSLKSFTDRDVVLPRHYIPDSTTVVTKKGKQYLDTVWHKVPDFNLVNQLGQNVSWKDLEGKIVVADFFFTHCPTICPTLTRNMKDLQDWIMNSEKVGSDRANFVQFLSFSIDPERDSVAQLKNWADRFQVDPQNWWLLTGNKKQIYDLAVNHLHVPAEDGGTIDSNFIHTDVFVVIDKNRNIRGYYHTVKRDEVNGGYKPDSAALAQIANDVVFLSMEKDPNKKFFLAGKLELVAVVFVILAIGMVLLFKFLKKEDK
jgi:protein SCO1/2